MKIPYIIGALLIIILIIWISVLGYFDGWVFFGMVFYTTIFLTGYFYVINGWKADQEREMDLKRNKNKFDYCFGRINNILRKMAGGQGIAWQEGVGMESKFRTFSDGTQNKPFRSVLGYLSKSEQLVLVIFDIDGDDIADYIANPTPDLLTNHFANFDPYKSKSSMGGFGGGLSSYDRYGRRRSSSRSSRGVSVHVGNEGMDNQGDRGVYEDFRTKPDEKTVDDAVKKII